MSDIEKLKLIFDEFGIEYNINDNNNEEIIIHIKEGNNKVSGYSSFFSDYCFEKKGKFKNIWIGE